MDGDCSDSRAFPHPAFVVHHCLVAFSLGQAHQTANAGWADTNNAGQSTVCGVLAPPLTNFGVGSSWELRFISKMGIELKWVSQGASVGVMDAEECLIQGFSKTVA